MTIQATIRLQSLTLIIAQYLIVQTAFLIETVILGGHFVLHSGPLYCPEKKQYIIAQMALRRSPGQPQNTLFVRNNEQTAPANCSGSSERKSPRNDHLRACSTNTMWMTSQTLLHNVARSTLINSQYIIVQGGGNPNRRLSFFLYTNSSKH